MVSIGQRRKGITSPSVQRYFIKPFLEYMSSNFCLYCIWFALLRWKQLSPKLNCKWYAPGMKLYVRQLNIWHIDILLFHFFYTVTRCTWQHLQDSKMIIRYTLFVMVNAGIDIHIAILVEISYYFIRCAHNLICVIYQSLVIYKKKFICTLTTNSVL